MFIGHAVKFVLLCLAAGIGLTVVGLGVEDFWFDVADKAKEGGDWMIDNDELLLEYAERAVPYMLAGAGIVAPIYAARYVFSRVVKR